MRDFKWFRLSAMLLVAAVAISCNKDEETDNSLYMSGSLTTNVPSHVIKGQELTFTASGITNPTDSLTYKWVTEHFSVDSIFGTSVTLSAPDSLGDYTVSIYVTHPRYSNKYLTFPLTVIDPTSEESFSGIVKGEEFITDSRDNRKYYYSTIGNYDWMVENLNWKGSGKPYKNVNALGEVYGRLYSYTDALTACPEGWELPSNDAWSDLATSANGGTPLLFDNIWTGIGGKLTVNAKLNSESIWKYSPSNNQLNYFNWNALPGGNVLGNYRSYINMGQYGAWWSATERDSNNAYYRYIYFDSADFPYNYTDKDNFGASVRCVRSSAVK